MGWKLGQRFERCGWEKDSGRDDELLRMMVLLGCRVGTGGCTCFRWDEVIEDMVGFVHFPPELSFQSPDLLVDQLLGLIGRQLLAT